MSPKSRPRTSNRAKPYATNAELISAYPVDNEQLERVSTVLAKRLGREVNLRVSVDDALLGGAIVRAGDMVIDGSVRGKLDKLAVTLGR